MNIGNGSPIHLLGFIEGMEKKMNIQAVKEFVGEQLGDVQFTHADITLISELTGYKSITQLDEGLENFIQWFLQYYSRLEIIQNELV